MVGSDVGTVEVARCGCVGCVAGRCGVLGFADSKQTYTTHTTSKRTLCVSPLYTFLISSSGSTYDPLHASPAPLPNSIGSH